MLLFSTMLDVSESMTREDFIKLIIIWNQTNKFSQNSITGLRWNGDVNIDVSSGNLRLYSTIYDKENIVMV